MPSETSSVFIEFYDEETTVVEVATQDYIEFYDGSFGTPTAIAAENLPFTHAGTLQTGIGATLYPIKGGSFTIVSVAAMLTSPPAGSSVIIDVNKNGSSIYTDQTRRPTIPAGATQAVVGTHSISSLTDGDYLSIDLDQVGSQNPGEYLVVVIRIQRIA